MDWPSLRVALRQGSVEVSTPPKYYSTPNGLKELCQLMLMLVKTALKLGSLLITT